MVHPQQFDLQDQGVSREGEQETAGPGKVRLARMDQIRNGSGWDYEREDIYT